jgi:precorrin-2/cobalt-factor-2 C20-methyltransferase
VAGAQGVSGRLYGIGVGPGDPDLLTVKAARLLAACPVVAYPAPEQGESLARRIAAPHLPAGKIEIAIRMALSPERFPAPEVYDAAAAEVSSHLAAGRDVAVLCLGDPLLYGSFMYLLARLAGTYRVEIVPGVASPTAAAAALGLPLAAGSDVLAILPAQLDDERLATALAASDVSAIIKLGRHFARVRALLGRLGLADHAHYVEHATMADQRIVPLAAIDPASVPYFSLIIVRRQGSAAGAVLR